MSCAPWLLPAAGPPSAQPQKPVPAAAIIREVNLARQNPGAYASFVEKMKASSSNYLAPGHSLWRTHEGTRALDEAITFLRHVRPRQPLVLSAGLCEAAEEHCNDQRGGALGHAGSDGSTPGRRISRYGTWQGGWAENISYGQHSAREIVLALIIDDGVRGRGHRKNIFNPNYSVAGAAYGPHARFGTVCSMNFAGAYFDGAFASVQQREAAAAF